ncbi:MAG: hypothetical protein K9M44_02690 [Candidatus Pacebacteria bacterium]|nr:hypothetical protein [Candidatus Paceibacterota bacterium]
MKKYLAIKIFLALLPAIVFTQDWAWISSNKIIGLAFLFFWILMIWQVISSEDKNFVIHRLLWLSEIAFFLLPVSAIALTLSFGSQVVSETEGIAQAGAAIGTAIGGVFAVVIGLIFGATGGIICHIFSKKYGKKIANKKSEKDFFTKTRAWSFWLGIIILAVIAVSVSGNNTVENNLNSSEDINNDSQTVEVVDEIVDNEKEEIRQKIEEGIEVVSTKIEEDILGTPNLIVSLKNNTDKTIDGINIEARFLNNFNESVSGLEFDDEPFGGTSQELIESGEVVEFQWMLVFYDGATKIDSFEITRVHFSDGEDWNLK